MDDDRVSQLEKEIAGLRAVLDVLDRPTASRRGALKLAGAAAATAMFSAGSGARNAAAGGLRVEALTTAPSFHPIAPTRVYDSRSPAPAAGVLAAPANRTVSVADGRDIVTGAVSVANVVPVGATAIACNVTVTGTVGAGYLTVNPGGNSVVAASTINWFGTGQSLANGVIVTISSDRMVTVIAGGGGQADFVLDVTGYFAADAGVVGGAPLVAPDKTWTWFDFPEAVCDDGSSTGVGLNLNGSSDTLLVLLNGGGACWDNTTCHVLNTAAHGPFAKTQFDAQVPALQSAWVFNRSDATNPFKNAHYVFVPYTTGDVHAGSNVATYNGTPYHHVGFTNMAAFLNRIVPTFPNVTKVILAGSSAGGFGAVFNWNQTQAAFGSIRVDVIDDSGPILPASTVPGGGVFNSNAFTNWNLSAALPAGCSSCATDVSTLYDYDANAHPGHRLALLSYSQDQTMRSYYGLSATDFQNALNTLVTNQFSGPVNAKAYIATGTSHTFLGTQPPNTTAGNALKGFLTKMLTDDSGWANVTV